MTQENKQLLLQDFCARLPYGVIVETSKGSGHICTDSFESLEQMEEELIKAMEE